MGNIFLRFLLNYSNACTISIMDMIVVHIGIIFTCKQLIEAFTITIICRKVL